MSELPANTREFGRINTIILAAGKFDARNVSAGMIKEVGLLPIRGKSSIAWVIDSAVKNGAENIKVVLRQSSTRLKHFLSYRYPEVEQVVLGEEGEDREVSPLTILGLCDDDLPTQIILGDTLINGDFPEESDVFLSSPKIKASKNWCLVSKDEQNHILQIYNKQEGIPLEGKEALVGYYKLSDTRLLKRIAMAQYSRGDCDFIRILALYNLQRPILIKTTEQWYDFSNINGMVQARLELFSAREFNNLEVDAVRGTITKISAKKQKLLDEVNWYRSLPPELAVYVPRIFHVEETAERVSVEMEMYGYTSLAESFLYGSGNYEDWYRIIESLMKVHRTLEQYTEPSDPRELEGIYVTKTRQRLEDIPRCAPRVHEMMQEDTLIINGAPYKNILQLRGRMEESIRRLLCYDKRTIVHGDYCFSNILFDPLHYIFKLIDPRGRFRDTQTIYGDPRYDIAKLRHSVVGLYDFIVAGFFKLNQDGKGGYEFLVSSPHISDELTSAFDEIIQSYGYDVRDIKLIEALIFLTIIPLHRDDELRQQAFYLTAIQKLNHVLYGD